MEQDVSLYGTLSNSEAQAIQWDVVVVGAGVAGAVAARETARIGRRVLLVDKRHFPRRKVCGACLNGVALDLFTKMGLSKTIADLHGRPLHEFALCCGSRSVKLPLPGGQAISRDALDAALVAEAISAGADFLPDTIAKVGRDADEFRELDLTHAGHETRLCARTIVVAAGLEGVGHSDSKEWTTSISTRSRLGAGCTIVDDTDGYAPGTIWMSVGQGGYVGLVRVEDGRLNIAAAFDRDFLRHHGSPAAATSQLLQTTRSVVPPHLMTAEWLGTVPLSRRTTPVASRRVFLIGDAAGYVEPFTGEGMAWALLTGCQVIPYLSQALRQRICPLEVARGWCREYQQLVRNRQRFCRVSTGLLRSQILMQIGLSALSSWPWLARRLIERINAPSTQGRLAHECRS